MERKKNMEHLHAESETQLLILPTGTNNNPESKNENNDTIIDIESKTKNPSEYSITDDSDTKIKYSTLPESILSSANVTTTTTFSTPVMSSTATIAQQTPNQTYHSPLQFSRRNHQRLLSDTQTTGFSTPILTKQRLALQQQSQQEIKNNYSPYMLQTSMQQQQQQQESLGILSNNNNNNNEYQQRFSNDFENNNHNNMPLNDAETYVIKKNLIIQELSRVAELMTQYYKQTKNLSFRGKIVQNTLLILLGLSMIGFFFNADRTPSEVKDIIYYVALVANAIGFLLTLLSFNWNYAEQEHNSNTTYRGLHHLHDYVSHQLVRNGLTTHQMDDLLAEMSSRLLLIRDSADLGTWKPLHI